ncbi:efflux RND transporter periplasmic adaptor subunit [Cohaesibacter sp. ES.047]|uniref:efflux RND transporter periplasmic adaptor subunit n=1 Tax=Cohaesibacter sp. ES.047 TaxID=1798205 RepID=UPI0012FDFF9D|nr:efflux RND transporter periplasmic adaptor subunit [Cohaesibacter sp. ES.047]
MKCEALRDRILVDQQLQQESHKPGHLPSDDPAASVDPRTMNYHSDEKPQPMLDRQAPSRADTNEAPDRQPSRSAGRKVMSAVRWFFRLALPLIVIVAAASIMNMLVATKPEVQRRQAREQAYAVQLVKASPATIQPDILVYGTVSAARRVDLRALVGGEVIWVSPELVEGGTIAKGADLVRVDPFEFEGAVEEANANLAEARARLAETRASSASEQASLQFLLEQERIARSDLERAETLIKSGSLTRQALESRKLTFSQREQAVKAAQNNLLVQKARIDQQQANIERLNWKLEQARRNLTNTTLTAPFTGVVLSKSVALGRSVSGSDTLVSLYDPQELEVRFTISDAQYGRLTSGNNQLVGRQITANWKLGDSIRSHKAVIERITAEISAGDGGIEVYARFAKGTDLRAGTFVELVVPDRNYSDAIRIPQAALYLGHTVYVHEDGRMQPRTVDVLAYLGDDVLIDGSALGDEAEIIATRIAEAGPGLKVVLPEAPAQDSDESNNPPAQPADQTERTQ